MDLTIVAMDKTGLTEMTMILHPLNKTKIVRKKRSNKKIHNYSKNWNYEEFLRKAKQLYDYIDHWIFFCRKTVSSLSIKTSKCFLLKLDELSWNLNGDYPRIILEVIKIWLRN